MFFLERKETIIILLLPLAAIRADLLKGTEEVVTDDTFLLPIILSEKFFIVLSFLS